MKYIVTGVVAWLFVLSPRAAAQSHDNIYIPKNLVSDLPGQAERIDKNLANPWGIIASSSGPFWIADNHTGVSTVYNGDGRPVPLGNPLVVTIPPPDGGMPPAAPTGIVFNATKSFELATGKPASFIFATEDGTIAAWNASVNLTQAILKVDNSPTGAVYKGLAIGNNGTADYISATNFNAGLVEVFDTHFAPALAGTFSDPKIPAGFAPFGIRNIGGKIYVTYAKQDDMKHDDEAGPGNGFVNEFDTNGNLVKRLISHGVLNSPWGLALAPEDFGALSKRLLVGNFGDGTIHAFDPESGADAGQVLIPSRAPFVVRGLWGLDFGNGAQDTETNSLYYTAGIPGPSGNVEDHGVFGFLRPQHPDAHRRNH